MTPLSKRMPLFPLSPLSLAAPVSLPIARRRLLAATACALAGTTTATGADLPTVIAAARGSVLPAGTFNALENPRFGFRGSAFVVGDGTLAVTNFHVLPPNPEADGAPRLAVLAGAAAGSETAQLRLARLVAVDRQHDLALLRLEGAPFPALTLDAADGAREGQAIALIGFPIGGALGFAPVSHRGIVASITRIALPAAQSQQLNAQAISRLRDGAFGVLQLDATAYPGNSGGPVLDADSGRVIGVLNMVLIKGSRETALSQPTGISYAIPVRHVHDLLKKAAG